MPKLRLMKSSDGHEQVFIADKKEGHMKRAELAHNAYCSRCQSQIGFRPFFRVRSQAETEDRLVHADPCARQF